MTTPQTVTADHLRALLATGEDDSTLVLVGGRIEVVAAVPGDDPDQGALELVSRADLRERLGDELDDARLQQEAAALTVAAQQQGG